MKLVIIRDRENEEYLNFMFLNNSTDVDDELLEFGVEPDSGHLVDVFDDVEAEFPKVSRTTRSRLS